MVHPYRIALCAPYHWTSYTGYQPGEELPTRAKELSRHQRDEAAPRQVHLCGRWRQVYGVARPYAMVSGMKVPLD